MERRFLVQEVLHEGTTTSILRATEVRSGARVVLKRLRAEQKSIAEEARLRHEFEILSRLVLPGVVSVQGLVEDEGSLAMVLADRGGESLYLRLRRGPVSLREGLVIAAHIACSLEGVHALRVIHKDVNPHNIVLFGDGTDVELIDFELASALPRVVEAGRLPELIEGTLAYIAPEQTGRTNRAVDTRADLYSLGATLYTLFTGRPPFESQDSIELVHAHIAKRPEPMCGRDNNIPKVVSDIVDKLLAKMPEERYQSASAVRKDLEVCLRTLDDEGRIEAFALAAGDVSERFLIPERLLGREEAKETIAAAYRRSFSFGAPPALLLVAGPVGSGRSALLREVARGLSETNARFAFATVDERDWDVPYAAITRALAPVVRELCASSEETLLFYRQSLTEALGSAALVLTEVLPDLAVVLGTPPETITEDAPRHVVSPGLLRPVDQARERTTFAFVRLFHVLAKTGLVLLLDDIDRADRATLELVERLALENATRGLLLLGSCREDAMEGALAGLLSRLGQTGALASTVFLGPLGASDVLSIVSGAVHRADLDTTKLAALVLKKTLGNPLFVSTFLSLLYRDRLIDFDHDKRSWFWDLDAIEAAPVSADVIELLSERVKRLRPEATALCRIAACFGVRFERSALVEVSGLEAREVDVLLAEAAEEGILLGGAATYAFAHERLREGLYAEIPEALRKQLHLRIGRWFWASAPRDNLFALLGHLNKAESLLPSPEERREIAWMNLEAGKKARAMASFEAASTHFEAGLLFLPADALRTHKDETLGLMFGAAEAAYSCGFRHRAEALYAQIAASAETEIERLRVDRALVRMHRHANEFAVALDVACAALGRAGIRLPKDPGLPTVLFEFAKAERQLWGKSPEDILASPRITSETHELIASIAEDALFIAFFERPMIQSVLACKLVSLSQTQGLSPVSPACFAGYALLVRMVRRDIDRADALCRMAQRMLSRFVNTSMAQLVHLTYAVLIAPFRYPLSTVVEELERTHRAALEAGDRPFTYFAGATLLQTFFQMGRPLGEVLLRMDADGRRLAELARVTNAPAGFDIGRRVAMFLQGRSSGDGFDSDELSDDAFVADLERDATKIGPIVYRYYRAFALLIVGRIDEARRLVDGFPKGAEQQLVAAYSVSEYYLTCGLVLAATARDRGPLGLGRDLLVIHGMQRKLAALAANAPASFEHKAELLAAECARLERRFGAAADHYERAAKLAHASGFLHEEAIALERAGLFWIERENAEIARSYLGRSLRAYARWGATAKVAAMETRYPALGRGEGSRASGRLGATMVSGEEGVTTTRTTSSVALDARAMVRASQAVSGEISLDRLLRKLIEVVVQATGAERGVLLLKASGSKEGEDFVVAARLSGQGEAIVPDAQAPLAADEDLPRSVLQFVTRMGKSLLCADAKTDPVTKADPYVVRRGTRSLLAVPIVRQGEMRGLLYLENDLSTGAFTVDRLSLCEVLAAQMSISVENALLYEGLERLVDERTSALKEAQARLVELEKTATEARMAGGFAHEMRNALTAAKMLLSIVLPRGDEGESKSLPVENGESLLALFGHLEDRVSAEVLDDIVPVLRDVNANEERIDNVLRLVWSSIERALGTTQLILEYAKLGSEFASDAEIALLPLVSAIGRESLSDFQQHGISFAVSVPAEARVRGKEEHWYSIIKNLVLNARDALLDVERDEGRRISISYEERDQKQVITVEDNGTGIAPEHVNRIFEPFFSTKPDTGTGLGLGVVKKLCALYGGTIAVGALGAEPSLGTRFSIELPRVG